MKAVCSKLKTCSLVLVVLSAMPLIILHFQIYQGPSTHVDQALREAILPRNSFMKRIDEAHVHLLKYSDEESRFILGPRNVIPRHQERHYKKAENQEVHQQRPTQSRHFTVSDGIAPKWQIALQKGKEPKSRVFLAEILQVRIYAHDKARWTLAELKQWMHYMFYAGVEHIYLCDHYEFEHEKLDTPLKQYIQLGLVTYLPWGKIRDAMQAQVQCYQHMIDNYKDKTDWQIAIDMDEYPYIASDTKEGFLTRYLKALSPDVAEVSMHNFLMMGQGDRSKDITIERINRRTPLAANPLDKPIYRPDRVRAQIHHNIIHEGKRVEVNDEELRMLHYWGARTQNWGPDTQETLDKTIVFNDMRKKMAPIIRKSLISFGEKEAFSNSTGP